MASLVTWPDLNHASTLSRLQSLRLARLVNQYLALIPGAQDNLAPRRYLAPGYLEWAPGLTVPDHNHVATAQ